MTTSAFQRWRRAGRAGLELVHGALFPRTALGRAARRAVYAHIEPLAVGRRVLDLGRGQSRGSSHLCSAGASEVVALAAPDQPSATAAGDLGVFDLIVGIVPGMRESFLDWTMDRLAPGGQLVVAASPHLAGRWHDLLQQQFLQVEAVTVFGSDAGVDVRFGTAASVASPETDSAKAVCQVLTASAALRHLPPGPRRLHIGAGSQRLEGWINVDIRPFPGVDLVADVTRGLELAGIDTVFAEHFLEHLAVDHALDFLAAVQRMLVAGGRLRLSTPNLDWVWQTHYDLAASPEDKVNAAVALNLAFHGWEHKFIWNRETLESALLATGFRDLVWHRHGESDVEHLRGLERHETYGDNDDLPHVLIVEGVKGTAAPEVLAAVRERLQRDFLDHVAGY